MKLFFISTLLVLLLFSCNDSSNNIETVEIQIPEGNWLITNSYSVNGPICIFIEKNDTINFQRDMLDEMGVVLNYKSGPDFHKDYFSCKIETDKLSGYGFYKLKLLTTDGMLKDTVYPQTLDIWFLERNKIRGIIKHSIFDHEENKLMFGEVSNFIAVKI